MPSKVLSKPQSHCLFFIIIILGGQSLWYQPTWHSTMHLTVTVRGNAAWPLKPGAICFVNFSSPPAGCTIPPFLLCRCWHTLNRSMRLHSNRENYPCFFFALGGGDPRWGTGRKQKVQVVGSKEQGDFPFCWAATCPQWVRNSWRKSQKWKSLGKKISWFDSRGSQKWNTTTWITPTLQSCWSLAAILQRFFPCFLSAGPPAPSATSAGDKCVCHPLPWQRLRTPFITLIPGPDAAIHLLCHPDTW